MRLLDGIDFTGIGAAEKKPKPPPPTVAPPLPTPVATNKSSFPTWLPYGVGAAGTAIIIMLLVTSKGKS